MSDAVSALQGAEWTEGIAQLRDVGITGMLSVRGALSSAPVKKAVKTVSGVDVPETWKGNWDGARGVVWMSPDELLLMGPYGDAGSDLAKLRQSLGKAHALAVNVSDARAVFELSGPHARDVMAKLTPLDLCPSAFGPGDFRRTRLAQVAGAIWMPDAQTFRIVCFRSVAQYMFDLLQTAAQPGSEVGYFELSAG